jgi:hypothetical protein
VIIQQAIWLYARFTLSFRDVEDLLAERGVMVSYETVRRWVNLEGRIAAFAREPNGGLIANGHPAGAAYQARPGRACPGQAGRRTPRISGVR